MGGGSPALFRREHIHSHRSGATGPCARSAYDRLIMNPYWLEEDAPPRRQVQHKGRVDVAIVGAGITGCSAALRLAEAGAARAGARPARRRRGRERPQRRLRAARRRDAHTTSRARRTASSRRASSGTGRSARSTGWRGSRATRSPAGQLPARRRRGGTRADPAEYDALREDGIAARVGRRPSRPRSPAGSRAAIVHPGDGAIQPARFVRRLAARAAEAGAEIREHDRVDDVDAPRRRRTSSSQRTATATGSCRSSPMRSGRPAAR